MPSPTIILAVLVAFLAVGGWGAWERGEAIRHRHRAEAAERVAESQRQQIGALERLQAETAARVARGNDIRRQIHAAPNGSACAASAPVRAVLGGLRAPAAGASNQPGPARVSAPARRS